MFNEKQKSWFLSDGTEKAYEVDNYARIINEDFQNVHIGITFKNSLAYPQIENGKYAGPYPRNIKNIIGYYVVLAVYLFNTDKKYLLAVQEFIRQCIISKGFEMTEYLEGQLKAALDDFIQ